jgi:hypothetical protein
MSEADETLAWAEYAEEDLILAKSALRRNKPLRKTWAGYRDMLCAPAIRGTNPILKKRRKRLKLP